VFFGGWNTGFQACRSKKTVSNFFPIQGFHPSKMGWNPVPRMAKTKRPSPFSG